jgi:autotransporter adhesin
MSAGIASVAAMSNIPHSIYTGQLSVGAGVGHYNGETAVAVGASYRYNEHVTTQLSAGANSGNNLNPVVGAGIAFAF